MNELAKTNAQTLTELIENTDMHTLSALRNSIYPGAKDESIAMAIAYCKARKYDPLTKPVHLVPMNVKNPITGKYEWRDTVMRGIVADRVDATRTGQYMGASLPQFGPIITENLGGSTIKYPEWCSIIVKKMMPNGVIAEFPSMVFWKEAYANKGKNKETNQVNPAPNAMWEKRPRGQLAKVAEAQALRMAFSDILPSDPTFEEIEGKTDMQSHIEHDASHPRDGFIDTVALVTLRNLIEATNTNETEMCLYMKVDCMESLTMDQFIQVKKILEKKLAKVKSENHPINDVEPEQHNQGGNPLNQGFETATPVEDDLDL